MEDQAGPGPDEEVRLRAAYARRGRPEDRLRTNPGQLQIVRERDEALRSLLGGRGRPVDLLEIGCGEGSIVAGLRDDGYVGDAVGVDLLPEYVASARDRHRGIRFEVADAAALPFGDAEFDYVLASTVLSSVPTGPRRQAILREVDRVLRPGGSFVWYDMRVRSPSNPDVRPFTAADVAASLPGYAIRVRPVTLAPPIARRLGRSTPVLYPLLAHVPFLRTHTVGLARKP